MWSGDTVIHRPPETQTRGRARVRQRKGGILAVPPSRKRGNVLIIEDSDSDDSQLPYTTAMGSRVNFLIPLQWGVGLPVRWEPWDVQ